MALVSVDRKLTRDYRSLSAAPWGLWDVMLARRSCRKYLPRAVEGALADELEGLVRLSSERRGARSPRRDWAPAGWAV